MSYVYVLLSLKDGKRYTGITDDLDRRIEEHNSGQVKSTKHRTPFKIIYYEWSEDLRDAMNREKYLKTYYGKHYIKNRVRYSQEQ